MAFGRIANVRWIRAEESESVSAMLDTIPNRERRAPQLQLKETLGSVACLSGSSHGCCQWGIMIGTPTAVAVDSDSDLNLDLRRSRTQRFQCPGQPTATAESLRCFRSHRDTQAATDSEFCPRPGSRTATVTMIAESRSMSKVYHDNLPIPTINEVPTLTRTAQVTVNNDSDATVGDSEHNSSSESLAA
jgi:hypothetical protein